MALRDRLINRPKPSITVSLRIYDDTVAQANLVKAKTIGNPDIIIEAEAAVEACYERLIITAIAPVEWEALVSMHPPTEEQKTIDKWCNSDTFYPALLALCTEGDETEDDWADFITKGALTRGEVIGLINAALEVNNRGPELFLKKE